MRTKLKPKEIRDMEKNVRERNPNNMDYGFMDVLRLFAKHGVEVAVEHNIKL